MGQIEVVTGGQYGSEGKGAITAWRGRVAQAASRPTLAMRVAGPNAGHTVIGARGASTADTVAPNLCEPIQVDAERIDVDPTTTEFVIGSAGIGRYAWRLRSVPVAAVVNPDATLALGAGSEIDLEVLLNEIRSLDAAGYEVSRRLVVDPEATLILPRHKTQEAAGGMEPWVLGVSGTSLTARQGSTGKGIGAARADRLWRVPGLRLGDSAEALDAVLATGTSVQPVTALAIDHLDRQNTVVQIEGTQGYGLGLHAGHYPFTTSSDCRAIDFLAMAGLSPWTAALNRNRTIEEALTVWVCFRPYPIRVGGNSGPLAYETTWDALRLPIEHTTVTGKVRRVGHWDAGLARAALRANGGPSPAVKVAFTMFDTIHPAAAGWDSLAGVEPNMEQAKIAFEAMADFERDLGTDIAAVGTGPDTVWEL